MAEQKTPAQANPEKKLLEIIEQQPGKTAAAGQKEGGIKSGAVRELKKKAGTALPDLFAGVVGLGGWFKALVNPAALRAFDFRKLNILLILLGVGLVVYAPVYLLGYKRNADHAFDAVLAAASAGSRNPAALTTAPGIDTAYLEDILQKIGRRDLFKPASVQKSATAGDFAAAKDEELLKDLRLVGVSIGSEGTDTYAMVEDVNTKITYFLKKDELIAGMRVADILHDRLLLQFQERTLELR